MKKEENKREDVNVNSIHKLQNARRKQRQKDIYEKLNKIKSEEKKEIKLEEEKIKQKEDKEVRDKNIKEKENLKNGIQENKTVNKDKKINNKKENKKKEKKENKKNKKLKTRKQWKKSRIIKSIIIVILLSILAFASLFVYRVFLNGGGLKGIIAATVGQTPNKLENLKPINVLVLGTNEGNTDSIILASYNPKTQEASMLSIPRDTFVGQNVNTAPASEKINALLTLQGIEKLKEKVEELTGMEIPYYIIVTTDHVGKLVDLVGGVDFNVPINMSYRDVRQNLNINLKKGMQKIDGNKAEMLLRFRHNQDGSTYPPEYGVEDIGRMKTQKNFIKALIKQSISKFDLSKIYELIGSADQYVKTNLEFKDYKDYVPYIIEMNPDNIKVARIEGRGILTRYYFFIPDYKKLDEIIFDLFVFSDDERKNDPSSFKVKRNINQITTKSSEFERRQESTISEKPTKNKKDENKKTETKPEPKQKEKPAPMPNPKVNEKPAPKPEPKPEPTPEPKPVVPKNENE